MTDATKGLIVWGVILAAGIGVGLGIGWRLWSPKPKTPETYAQAFKQPDGSVGLEKKPQPDAKPPHEVPKGAKVERIVQVTVKPNPPVEPVSPLPSGSAALAAGEVPERPPCPPVRVDLSLVRMPDQTHRVIASSPDGEVVGGVDIPVENPAPQRTLKWAAGFEYAASAWGNTKSLVVQRDLGFVRLGGRVGRVVMTAPAGTTLTGSETAVSVMIRF